MSYPEPMVTISLKEYNSLKDKVKEVDKDEALKMLEDYAVISGILLGLRGSRLPYEEILHILKSNTEFNLKIAEDRSGNYGSGISVISSSVNYKIYLISKNKKENATIS